MKQVVCLSALLIVCMINVAIYGQQDSSLYSRQSFRAKARIKKEPVKKAPGRSVVASLPPLPKSNTDSSRSRASAQHSTGIRLDNSLLPLSTHVEINEAGQASGAVNTRDELARTSSASRPAVLEAPATLAVAASRSDSIALPPGGEMNSTESLGSTAPETQLAQPLPLKLDYFDEPESTSDLDLHNESDPWYELGQFGLGDSDSVVTSVAPTMDDPGIETVGYSGGLVESNPGYALKTPISTHRARQATRTGSKTGDGRGYSFLGFFKRRLGYDKGLGHERVMFAPFALDTATSLPNTSITLSAAQGLGTPDRLEYFWASPQIGPAAESRVDVLDTVFRTELGNRKAMAIASYTMRSLNPDRNDNTTGFGDMTVGGKVLLVDSKCTQIASIFQTYLKTGPADRGLGTGHVSLEPGILFRQQLSELTFFHAEAKYWIPIAGREGFAGDVLKLGAGVSTIWKESDRHALMPTLELLTYNFLAGSKTDALGNTVRVNGNFAAEVLPGLRCAFGESALGMHEFGVSAGTKIADRDWFDTRLLLQLRFVR